MRTLSIIAITTILAYQTGKTQEKPPVPKYPEPETVLDSMKRATTFYRTHLSFAGGYARAWSRDLRESHTEETTATTVISIQPHGTTTVGRAMLRAHISTGDPLFLQGAKEAADALAWCQLASGGWNAEHGYDLRTARHFHYRRDIEAGDTARGERRARSTLDDNKTQSAIRFLMEFANSPAGADNTDLHTTLDYAWQGLLSSQAPNGAWPQQFSGPSDPSHPVVKASFPTEWSRTFPNVDYTGHYTLNDGNLTHIMNLLLDAHRLDETRNGRFLEAAKKLGDFLLLAQMPDPQPVWAQQYNHEMHPVWARKFEPPSVSSRESLSAMQTLIDIWLATGDEKYIAPLPAALDWFERSKLEGEENTWARFYELQTNTPLYCEAETYLVTHDDSNLPTHYGFKLDGLSGKLERMRQTISKDRSELLAKRERDQSPPSSEKKWSERAQELASQARQALKNQKDDGYWVKGPLIEASEYVSRMKALTDYLVAANIGGKTFEAVREKEAAKANTEKAQ